MAPYLEVDAETTESVASDIKLIRATEDPLSWALGFLRLKGARAASHVQIGSFCRNITPEYGIFHAAVEGDMYVRYDSHSISLNQGDMVVFVSPKPHQIGSVSVAGVQPDGRCAWTSGSFMLDQGLTRAVLRGVPEPLVIRGINRSPPDWLSAAKHFLELELVEAVPGQAAMIARLIEIILIRALRSWSSDADMRGTLLAASMDRRISKVLQEIGRNPISPWSIERMALIANMSKSAFAARFKKVVGLTPNDVVQYHRIELAIVMLRNPDLSISEIADHIGYESEASFARAFRRGMQLSPTEWRESCQLKESVASPAS